MPIDIEHLAEGATAAGVTATQAVLTATVALTTEDSTDAGDTNPWDALTAEGVSGTTSTPSWVDLDISGHAHITQAGLYLIAYTASISGAPAASTITWDCLFPFNGAAQNFPIVAANKQFGVAYTGLVKTADAPFQLAGYLYVPSGDLGGSNFTASCRVQKLG